MLKWWMDDGTTNTMLPFINATYGPPKNFIYSIACQTYFGGAQVTGTFTGNISETVTGTTDGTGTAVLTTTKTAKTVTTLTFCVDNVTHASLPYNPVDNVETCDNL